MVQIASDEFVVVRLGSADKALSRRDQTCCYRLVRRAGTSWVRNNHCFGGARAPVPSVPGHSGVT